MASAAIEKVKEAANANTGLGVALGAVMGAVFGGIPGAVIGGTVGGAIAHAAPRIQPRAEMTLKLRLLFEKAMTSTNDPGELRQLAAAFEREGYRVQARLLRARAELRELPEEEKELRRKAIARAMASDNVDAIEEMAAIFQDCCALDAAKALHLHAAAVRAAVAAGQSAKPVAPDMVAAFTAKLTQAIAHFGKTSAQAQSAAANLLRAQGKTPDESSVAETIGEHVPAATAAAAAASPAAPASPPAAAPSPAPAATTPPEEDDSAIPPPVTAHAAPASAVNPPEPVAMPDAVAEMAAASAAMLAQIPGATPGPTGAP
jgi:hypothetical protein